MGKKGKGAKKAAPLTPEELERLRAETDLLVHEWGATRSKVGFEVIMSVIEARRLGAQPCDSSVPKPEPATASPLGVVAFGDVQTPWNRATMNRSRAVAQNQYITFRCSKALCRRLLEHCSCHAHALFDPVSCGVKVHERVRARTRAS
jgi:hypothetical protein